MSLLDRDRILSTEDLPRELVQVPEWGGEVLVRALTAAERDAYNNALFQVKPRGKGQPEITYNPQNATARLVALSVVDEEGNRLFRDSEVQLLAQKNAKALERIAAVARRLSGIDEESRAEIEGNSPDAQSEGSASG